SGTLAPLSTGSISCDTTTLPDCGGGGATGQISASVDITPSGVTMNESLSLGEASCGTCANDGVQVGGENDVLCDIPATDAIDISTTNVAVECFRDCSLDCSDFPQEAYPTCVSPYLCAGCLSCGGPTNNCGSFNLLSADLICQYIGCGDQCF